MPRAERATRSYSAFTLGNEAGLSTVKVEDFIPFLSERPGFLQAMTERMCSRLTRAYTLRWFMKLPIGERPDAMPRYASKQRDIPSDPMPLSAIERAPFAHTTTEAVPGMHRHREHGPGETSGD